MKALRKLDKVVKDKNGKSTYVMDFEDLATNDSYIQAEEEDGNSEDFIYVAEGDLDGTYSEEEMIELSGSQRCVEESAQWKRLLQQRLLQGQVQGACGTAQTQDTVLEMWRS